MKPRDLFQRPWAPAALAAVAACALYAVTLGGTYVYDDRPVILNDPRVTNPSNWRAFWTGQYFPGGIDYLYRPLVNQSFGLQWWLHGDKPWAFHLVNVLLHAATAAAVAELVRRLFAHRAAVIAGLLFAAMPVHVEAVAELVGRAELGCALAGVVALVLAARRPMTTPRAAAVAFMTLVSVLCKEGGFLIPAVLAALVWATTPQAAAAMTPDERRADRRALARLALMLVWIVAGVILLREEALGLNFAWDRQHVDWRINPLVRSHGADRVLIPFAILGRYVQLLLAPAHLSIDYGPAIIGRAIDRADPYLWAGFATVVVWIIGLVVAVRRGARAVAFCLLGLAISYSMISGVVLIGTHMGDRLMYTPSVFVAALLAAGLARLRPPTGAAVTAVLVGLASLRTVTYAKQWNDRLTLYTECLYAYPRSLQLHLLVAEELHARGDLADARLALAQAREVVPEHWSAWWQSAVLELELHHPKEELEFARRAFELEDNGFTGPALVEAMNHNGIGPSTRRRPTTRAATRPVRPMRP